MDIFKKIKLLEKYSCFALEKQLITTRYLKHGVGIFIQMR